MTQTAKLGLRPDADHDVDWEALQQLHEKISAALIGGDSGVLLIEGGDWQGSAIPAWGQVIWFPAIRSLKCSAGNSPGGDALLGLISEFVVGAGEVVLRELQRLRYLGPIRAVPPRNYAPRTSPDQARWANGLAAWDLLYSHYDQQARTGDAFLKDITRRLSSDEELGLGYSVELADCYELRDDSIIMNHLRMISSEGQSLDGELFMEPIRRELERLQPQRKLILHDEVNNTDVKPQDIGVGISQVIPVVVGAMDATCSVFAVEQPELHVHPRIQCSLGDIFAGEAAKNDGRVFLIETHSEHLILRLLRRIRETTENELPPGKPALRADQVAVYYVEGGEDGMKVTEISVAPDGDFTRQWPQGFFEEREEELF